MNDEKMTKQVWQTPEIIDLDVDKTSGGKANDPSEPSPATGPS